MDKLHMCLLLLLCAGTSAMRQPTAEDLKKIDQLGAIVSPAVFQLTNENYREIFNGSDWLVLLCHDQSLKCKMLNVPWTRIAESPKRYPMIMAKAMANSTLDLFRLMAIRDVPSVLVVAGGYIYNYTGTTDWRTLEELLRDQTYLQYDRWPVKKPAFKQFSQLVDRVFKQQPALYWAAELALVLILSAVLCRKKPPAEEKTKKD